MKRLFDASGSLAVQDFETIGAAEKRTVNPINNARYRLFDAEAVQIDAAWRRCRARSAYVGFVLGLRAAELRPRALRRLVQILFAAPCRDVPHADAILSVPAGLDDDPSLVSKGPHDNVMAGGPPRRG